MERFFTADFADRRDLLATSVRGETFPHVIPVFDPFFRGLSFLGSDVLLDINSNSKGRRGAEQYE
jgi:hypothetical protein